MTGLILEPAAGPPLSLLVVDDHPIVTSGVRFALARESDISVGEARSLAEAKTVITRQLPDIMLLDSDLPDGSGLDFCASIAVAHPTIKTLLFSTAASPTCALDALQKGAKGFIRKIDEAILLRDAVRALAAGEIWLTDEIATNATALKAGSQMRVTLSTRERQIIVSLASGRNLAQIAKATSVSYWTIAKDCQALREKLKARNATELVRIALELKLV